MNTDILLITPPFTQLNTPYPATQVLSGFLKEKNFKTAQLDLGIKTFLKIFSKSVLEEIFAVVGTNRDLSKIDYISNIDPIISFLQGKDNSLAYSICNGMLPKSIHSNEYLDMELLFGTMGITDKAKYLATLFIEDIGTYISENIDEDFGFSRYAEQVGMNANSFEKLNSKLETDTIITQKMCEILDENIKIHHPKIVSFSIPFPGNLFSALKSAQFIKKNYPEIKIVIGGGFVNTELRELSEKRLFNFVDFVCLDDGERPLLQLLDFLLNNGKKENLVRTFLLEDNEVKFINNTEFSDFNHDEIGTPNYEGINTTDYVSFVEMTNPMMRLWNDGRWNKLAIAHGCYWAKCSFCDVSLDYIKRYSKTSAKTLCDRIENIILQTNQRGFHFVDEAAPPQLLKEMALEILSRNLKITWWTNIRFEKTFSYDLCQLLAKSGCVAVSGGLEVASDRLLELMQKGVSIEQVTQVCNNFEQSGIMVHAYLMYGFPTETEQETIDALEIVRQMFMNGIIQSAFWHKFTMTVHSPIGQNPEKFGVKRIENAHKGFALNDCKHSDTANNHDKFSDGLKKALYNYMHNVGFDFDLQEFFDFEIPETTINSSTIANYLRNSSKNENKENGKVLWLASFPEIEKSKPKHKTLFFEYKQNSVSIEISEIESDWLMNILKEILFAKQTINFDYLEKSYRNKTKLDFAQFQKSKSWKVLRKNGLVII